jgi:hypothetical protein
MTPSVVSERLKRAPRATTRRWHASASSHPPPEFAPAARGRALNRGDDGRAARLDLLADLLPALSLLKRACLVQLRKLRDVRARAEVAPLAAEDYRAQVRTRGHAREDFADPFEHRARQGVPLLGSREPHVSHTAALFVTDSQAQSFKFKVEEGVESSRFKVCATRGVSSFEP